MPDKQNPNDPTYDWLYAQRSGPPADGEPTRAIKRPEEPDSVEEPTSSDDEHTSVIEQASPADAQAAEPTRALDVAAGSTAAATAAGPQSFGGTYPAPAPQSTQHTQPPRYTPPPPQQTPTGPPGQPPAAPSTAGRPPAKRRKKRNWWVRGIVCFVIAWLVFLVAVPVLAWTRISKVDAEPEGQRPADTPGTTYLLVGSDSRADLSDEQRGELGTGNAGGERTDTIIMLHVPDGDGPRLLLSIPRDSYVDIPGHGMNKINAAYALGGPSLLVETVEKATNLRVDDYVEIGFGGFVDVVDAVGGITICPETAINDPKAGDLELEKGCQEVDGVTALGYSRSRAFPLGDITRAEHQREVIAAVGKKAASWQTVVFPWRYLKVNMAAADTLRVGENVGPIDLARFAWAMSHTSGDDAKRCVVPYSSLGTSTDVGSVVTWDDDAAKAVFTAVRQDDTASIKCSASGK